jgi:IS4 transposase
MSHQDMLSENVRLNADCLKLALRWLLSGISWPSVRFRDDCSWTPRLLAAAAMLWSWSDELTLVERFQSTRKIIQFIFPRQVQLATSYQAFLKILRRWTADLTALLQTALRDRLREGLSDRWETAGWVMFAVDGSRIDLPRTRSHEATYSSTRASKRGKKRHGKKHLLKANSPQMWLTTMWHAGSGLPWDWRLGPADSSERAHLLEMLPALPAGSLITADAGFVGYDYIRAIVDSDRELLLRVGSNVRLLRQLGYVRESSGTVYLWPNKQAKQGQPPLALRLVVAEGGKHPVYIVTTVRQKSQMSDAQVLSLYRHRWGIELFYRSFKQTFGRRKLRSTSADNAQIEIEWSLLGLWAMALYALVQANRHGTPPSRLSIAQTMRAYRRKLRDYRHPTERGDRLRECLGCAVIDNYHRENKTSRKYPRKKQEQPPGAPKISHATNQQIKQSKRLAATVRKKGLTA